VQVSVYFQKIKEEILSSLKNANKEIKVAVAWLTDEDIIRMLGQRSIAGVSVKIIISDSKENFKNLNKLKELIRNKSELFIVSPKFLHHKFCIIDDAKIINGSYNWTYYAQSNEENILIISIDKKQHDDEALLNKFNTKFKFYCEKASTQVLETKTLNDFKEFGKEATIFANLDEEEIKLRYELEEDFEWGEDDCNNDEEDEDGI
jgi:phosphatidylserine/phosphatidylglycerophosphate/cardiolipin synthase-like enzyme